MRIRTMTHPILDQLKTGLISRLNNMYGYCGCADMPNKAILNSGGDGEDFLITIEDRGAPKEKPCTPP